MNSLIEGSYFQYPNGSMAIAALAGSPGCRLWVLLPRMNADQSRYAKDAEPKLQANGAKPKLLS